MKIWQGSPKFTDGGRTMRACTFKPFSKIKKKVFFCGSKQQISKKKNAKNSPCLDTFYPLLYKLYYNIEATHLSNTSKPFTAVVMNVLLYERLFEVVAPKCFFNKPLLSALFETMCFIGWDVNLQNNVVRQCRFAFLRNR